MYKFTITSVLLLVYVVVADCSVTSKKYNLTQRKLQINNQMKHEFLIKNLRLEHGKEHSLVSC